MTKLTNLVGSPFDVQTLGGPAVLPAFGTLEASFDSGYLQVLTMGGYILATEEVKKPVPAPTPSQAKDPEDEDLSELQAEYRELSGKDADKRWSDKRLADEIAKIKKG